MTKSEMVQRVLDAYHHPAVDSVMPYDKFFVRFGLLYGKRWIDLSDIEKDRAKKGNFKGCYSLVTSFDALEIDSNFKFTAYTCGYLLGVAESIEHYTHENNWNSQR